VNRGQAGRLTELAERGLGNLRGRRVAVLGAAFKAGTDDLRDSPALRVVGELVARGAIVVVYDPLVGVDALRDALPADGVEIASTLADAIGDVEACLVTTLAPEFDELERLLRERNGTRPLVVDGRRGIAPAGFPDHGYVGVGRAASWS
jgi:UDP-glucose 6-dehydrogenase